MPYDGRLLSGVTVLAAVIEAGTIVRASEALGLTASAVSRAVSRLEARVGARLLNRTTRSLTLTDEGRRFYERVGPHLDGIEEAAIEAAGSTNLVRGRLRINVDPFFSRIVLAGHVVTFLQQHPDVRLEGTSNNSGSSVEFAGATLRRVFLLLIWRDCASFYGSGALLRALWTHYSLRPRRAAPVSQVGGCCGRGSADRSWPSPA